MKRQMLILSILLASQAAMSDELHCVFTDGDKLYALNKRGYNYEGKGTTADGVEYYARVAPKREQHEAPKDLSIVRVRVDMGGMVTETGYLYVPESPTDGGSFRESSKRERATRLLTVRTSKDGESHILADVSCFIKK